MPLSRLELELAELSARIPGADPALHRLLRITNLPTVSIGLAISVLVDGVIIRGNLASSERFAKAVDHGLEDGMQAYGEQQAAESPEVAVAQAFLTAVKDRFSEDLAAWRREEDALQEELKAFAKDHDLDVDALTVKDLPDELASRQLAHRTNVGAFTLENAVLVSAHSDREVPVGMIRIQASSVGAWWTGFGSPDPGDPPSTE